jgi:hypothetical protein
MFVDELRHRCRRCSVKLVAPVSNLREAFCCRGCHRNYYDAHCMACEQPMVRTNANQRICGKRECRAEFNSLKAHFLLGRYMPRMAFRPDVPDTAVLTSETPIFKGSAGSTEGDRPWRLVTGPPIHMRLATIGAEDAVKQANRTNRRHCSEAGAAALIKSTTRR